MIVIETDAPDVVLSASVRSKRGGAARKARPVGPSFDRRGWSEARLSDTWPLAVLEDLRADLVAAGYRVYITVTPGPI